MNLETNSPQNPDEANLNIEKKEEIKQDEIKEYAINDELSANAPNKAQLSSGKHKVVGVDEHRRPVPPRE